MGEFEILLEKLPVDLRDAVAAADKPGLSDGPRNSALAKLLQMPIVDPPSVGCMAGLWLLAGDLNRSHKISQDDHSSEGSFWHGIMHRREGDFSNAKYWFRQVGRHPVIEQLKSESPKAYLDPYQFVDLVEESVGKQLHAPELLHTQWLEWCYLMKHCATAK